MYNERHLLLIDKANNYITRLNEKEYTPDGKAATALLYQIDTMIYGLSGINTTDWQGFLKTFKEIKYLLRIHSRDESVKKANYDKSIADTLETLEKYVGYLQSTLQAEPI
ncbi:MAG: hypothetical protein K0Q79_555 [Flavipsychrobacter sp.]|jgi:hypothetical protein|nr:hypothetical protein [Flavipsychrobacter sp.]